MPGKIKDKERGEKRKRGKGGEKKIAGSRGRRAAGRGWGKG